MRHRLSTRELVCASHILSTHKGKCSNLHGHNYVIEVMIDADAPVFERLSKCEGMIIDFGDLKEIIHLLDHAFIYNVNSETERDFAFLAEANGMRTFSMPVPTTAENIAIHLADMIKETLYERTFGDVVAGSELDLTLSDCRTTIEVKIAETEKHKTSALVVM